MVAFLVPFVERFICRAMYLSRNMFVDLFKAATKECCRYGYDVWRKGTGL
jgi:hypothetical protein